MVPEPVWAKLATDQQAVLARSQLLELGLTRSQAARHLNNGQWQTILPGVYLTHRGAVSNDAMAWAALLYAGTGAALSHGTALWLDGVLDESPAVVHVTIPGDRRVRAPKGLRIHRLSALSARVHPSRAPARTRIEESVLDQLDLCGSVGVIDILTRSTQRRRTTAARLREALADRSRHLHRALIEQVLADIDEGVQSPLERRYLRDVERAHGLPRGDRNRAERVGAANRYHDVRYRPWSVVVELDGRIAHPIEGAVRDLRRDNRLILDGEAVLRFGWRDILAEPCAVGSQVARLLCAHGWSGSPQPCGASCRVSAAA